jgi:hypothetical protein
MCLIQRHLATAGQACAEEMRLVDGMEQGMGCLLGQLAAVQILLVSRPSQRERDRGTEGQTHTDRQREREREREM